MSTGSVPPMSVVGPISAAHASRKRTSGSHASGSAPERRRLTYESMSPSSRITLWKPKRAMPSSSQP